MKNEIAVIGANGFLGSNLINTLVKNYQNVIAVHNGNVHNINTKSSLMTTKLFLESNLNIEIIYFAVGNYLSTHTQLLEINELLFKILKKFKNSKIIYVSSTNVYGFHQDLISLNSSFNNPTLYGLSKLAGEFIVKSHQKYVILRLTYLYGIGLNNNSFIPNLISNSIENGVITLFGEGIRAQDYLFIEDAVSLCIASSELESNEVLMGATGTSITNREIASIISLYNNCEIKYSGIDSSASFYFDIENTLNKVKWFPKISINQGLNEVLKF